jgi:hypothetical protein
VTMSRQTRLLLVISLLLVLTAALLLPLRGPGSRCHLALSILGVTNDPTAAKLVTLRLLNDGEHAAQVLPAYGFETQPSKVDASMLGSVTGGVRALRPGEAWTISVALPSLDDRSWRVFFRYWEQRSPVNGFVHYWLMQAGLAKREEDGSIAYSDWVPSQPGGPANRSQPVHSGTNETSAAAGSGR